MVVPVQKLFPFSGIANTKGEAGKSGRGYEELEDYQCNAFLTFLQISIYERNKSGNTRPLAGTLEFSTDNKHIKY